MRDDAHLLFETKVVTELHLEPSGATHQHPTGERCIHIHLFPGGEDDVVDLAFRIEAMAVDMFRLHRELKDEGRAIIPMPGSEMA